MKNRASMSVVGMLKSTRGNMSTMFALTMTFLLTSIGAAIDYGRVNHQETIAGTMADAAVLAGVAAAIEADKLGKTNAKALGEEAAKNSWMANRKQLRFAVAGEPEILISKSDTNEWIATATFKHNFSTQFMSMFGKDMFPVTAFAQAGSTMGKLKEYWDIHLAVDTSASMGLGATQADIDSMTKDPNMLNCAFACHMASGPYNTMPIAKSRGYKLRLDVVDEAIDNVTSKLQKISSGGNIRMALHGFDDTFSQLVTRTSDLEKIKSHDIQMKKVTGSYGNTNFRIGLNAVEAQVGKSGDGISSKEPKTMAIIITDGVHDHSIKESNVVTDLGKNYKLGPISADFCDKMKKNGAKVGVLYVPYLTPTGYEGYTNAYINDVPKNLKACASENMFFEATKSADIEDMLGNIITEAFGEDSALRLTQ